MCADFDEIWIKDSQFDILECTSGFNWLGNDEGAMANIKYNILTQISINFDQIH